MKSLINLAYKLTAVSGILAVAFFAFAGNAYAINDTLTPCVNIGARLVDATQTISNDPDSGVPGNYWALDTYTRHIQVWQSNVGSTTFCAQVDYDGTFHAPAGVSSPQTGQAITQDINGTMIGGYRATITGNILANPNIPTTLDYQGVLPTGERTGAVYWLDVTFNPEYTFVDYLNGGTDWSWTYTSDNGGANGVWVNAGTGNSGDIGMIVNKTTGHVYSTIQAAIDASTAGDTITLGSDITINSQLNINKAITLDGAGHTLLAPFTGVKNTSDSAIEISVNNVTIRNLIEDGTGTTGDRGINIYRVTGILLDNVTASNNAKNGIVVNGSTVIVNNIKTSGNAWDGIDVDKGTLASLTVNGVSSHTESKAAIKIDDASTGAYTVTDSNHQYSHIDIGNARLFNLLATGQIAPENGTATVTPEDKEVVVTATTPITVNLGSVEDATINFDSLVDNTTGSGILPETTITSNVAEVKIDAGTTVTAAGWDGKMQAPSVGDSSGTAPASFSVGNTVIEMGSSQYTLNFDKAVKITLPGVTGRVGYKPAGSTEWQLITTQCTSVTDPGITSGECYVADGGNTIIWTYHFTSFGGLDPISVIRSGGRSGGNRVTTLPSQASPVAVGRVLGAFTGPEGTNLDSPAVVAIKAQIAGLIAQLIGLLREQLATAIAAGLR